MVVVDVLRRVGDANLREVPGGGVIAEMAEVALNDTLPKTVTGSQVECLLSSATTPGLATKLLTKVISSEAVRDETWDAVQKQATEISDGELAKTKAIKVIVFATTAISITLCLLYVYSYFATGILPDNDQLSLVFGLPIAVLLSVIGMRNEVMQEMVLQYIIERMQKKAI